MLKELFYFLVLIFVFDSQAANLDILANDISTRSGINQNYISRVNAISRDTTKPMAWQNASCFALLSQSDCFDILGVNHLTTFASDTFRALLNQDQKVMQSKKRNIFDMNTRANISELPRSEVRSQDKELMCSCVESVFMAQMGEEGKQDQLQNVIDRRSNNLADEVLQSFGKKFINDYAHLYEDGIYFLNHTNLIPARKSETLLCRGADRFEKAVSKRCPEKDKNILSERMDIIFGQMDFGGASTLEEKLKYVDLNTIQRKSKDSNGNEFTYLRTEYDKTRYGLKTANHFKSLDRILTNVLTQGDLDSIKKRYPFKNGLEILSMYLSDLLVRDFDGTVKNLLKDAPPHIIEEWRDIKNGPNPRSDFETRFVNYHLKVIPSNPALASVLLDGALFNKFHKSVKNKKITSIFDELENNFTEMQKHMEDRCDEMVASFAEVVCLEKEEVLGGLSDEGILNFVGDKNDEYDPLNGINDILACRANKNTIIAFQNLNKEGSKLLNSDYFGLIENKENATDAYSTLAHKVANDEESRKLMEAAAKVSDGAPKRKSSYNPLTAHFESLKKDRFIDSSGTILEVKNSQMVSEKVDLKNVENEMTPNHSLNSSAGAFEVLNSQLNTQVQPLNNFKVVNNDSKEVFDFLSNHDDKEVINRHVSHLNSQEISELNRYKTSVLKEKEDLLNLKLDEEKKNLEKLQAQIDSLTSSKSMMEDLTSKAKTGDARSTKVFSQDTKGTVSTDLNERSFPGRLEARSHSASTPVTGQIGASSPNMGGGANISSGGSSLSSGAARSIASIPAPSIEAKDSNSSVRGLVLSAKSPISDNKQEITQNIVEYLKSADSETLLKFTKEGVTYQYQTLENGVLIEKEVHVSLDDVDPEMLAEIIKESEVKIEKLQRKYSYEALKIIISEEALKL